MTQTRRAVVLAIGGLLVTHSAPALPQAAQVIKINASKYHFTPDRIVLEKGKPVTLELTSSDRTHGFMVKPLGIDTDIEPGKTTAVTLRPDKAGSYTTICDHYCGLGHTFMKMTIVVEDGGSTALRASAK